MKVKIGEEVLKALLSKLSELQKRVADLEEIVGVKK